MRFLEDQAWLVAAMSEAGDGNMRIGPETPPDLRAEREAARAAFLGRAGTPSPLVTPYLVHGNRIAVISGENGHLTCNRSSDQKLDRLFPPYVSGVDALVTDAPGLVIGVTAADCVPVFIADPKRRAIGIVHAGWRGIARGVIENSISTMRDAFGSDPADIRAAIGPCIRSCHFEVGEEVKSQFLVAAVERRGGKTFVDLPLACHQALIRANMRQIAIEDCGVCTFDDSRFFSHRRGREGDEACLAAIAIRESS